MTPEARPVLKWAGGKRRLARTILSRLPARVHTYFEPFVGGAAIFFALAAQGRFKKAVLSDQNEELVSVYRALQTDVEALIALLQSYERQHSERTYYEVRQKRPRSIIRKAARTIYLNKTGYNGLYRVNRAGEFNVPFGRYTKPTICDVDNLRAAAAALRGVRIEIGDFEHTCEKAKPGDFVYLDPPYLPASKTASFTDYHRTPFGIGEHQRLASAFARMGRRGVSSLLSNSDTPTTRRVFEGFPFDVIQVSRPINSDTKGRGPVAELLFFNKPKSALQRYAAASVSKR